MKDVRNQEKQKGRGGGGGGGGGGEGGGGRLSRMMQRCKARLYIIQRCIVVLLCSHD
jgi:hypothetical protein